MNGAGEQLGLLDPGSVSGSGSVSFDHESPEGERQGWFLRDRTETDLMTALTILTIIIDISVSWI